MWPNPRARRYLATDLSTLSTVANHIHNLVSAIRLVYGKDQSDCAEYSRAFPAIHLFALTQQSIKNEIAQPWLVIHGLEKNQQGVGSTYGVWLELKLTQ